jgi:two-component system, cell cycle sensor histidine kinase and response regulator CckA
VQLLLLWEPMDEQRVNVLLVEDEPVYAELLQAVLRELSSSQCELAIAQRLDEALECLKSRHFDVLLLDLSLPDRQGLETYRAVKMQAGALPVIVLTGSDDERLALQAMREGAQDYLVKGQVDGRMVLRVMRYAIERKRAQEVLREREEFFRLISENVQDLVAVIDRDGRRLYNSPSYRSILGDPTQLAGSDSFCEIHPDDRESVRQVFQETLRTGVGQRTEFRLVRPDGSVRYVESQGSAIRDIAGQPSKVVVVSRDITDRKESVEVLRQALTDLKKSHEELKATQLQLIQAEKLEAISTFAAGVAHEVKNPLQAIILGIDFLANHVVSHDETGMQVLQEMSQSVHRADAIIRGLMEFATYRPREVKDQDLSAIVEQSLRSVHTELASSPIVLVKHLAENLPPLRLDQRTLRHVFINLLTTAIRSMPEGGTLTVRTFTRQLAEGDPDLQGRSRTLKPGDTLVVAEVEDTGAGVLESKLSSASDTELAQRAVRRGSGLGLTVVRKIIELYGGMMQVPDEPQGNARVVIQFKAQQRQAA